jgi:hypothetical protein
MKAFSKSNKACLCQVPQNVRKAKLPGSGCKLCGCLGKYFFMKDVIHRTIKFNKEIINKKSNIEKSRIIVSIF